MQRLTFIICTLMIVVGVGLRFSYLDSKVFGNDEATTSLHVSGKTIAEYAAAMFDGKARTANDILVFQRPDSRHGNADVVRSLAVEDPQHPPLYYLIERQWELVAGSAIASRRVVAAIFGSIAILSAIWLGYEIRSLLTGALTGALVAVSPFSIAYSQVAREYSLWLALTFTSSALVVRAIRSGNWYIWLAYAAAAIAGLYTDALFLLVVLAHGVVIVLPSRSRRRTVLQFIVAMLITFAAYLPWLNALRYGYTHGIVTNNTYLGAALSLKPFLLKWLFNFGSLFYDADYLYPKTAILILPGIIALAISYVLFVRRGRNATAVGVVAALAAISIVALVVPDLLHHEQRSTASRYLVPLWASCYCALGFSLALGITSDRAAARTMSLAFLIFTGLTGIGSFIIWAPLDTWWVDGSTAPVASVSRAVHRTSDPTIVYHASWGPGSRGPEVWDFTVVMLADLVPPNTRFVQYARDSEVAIPRLGGTLLLLDPTSTLIESLRSRGDSLSMIGGGTAMPVSADIASLRRTVALERARQGTRAILSPTPSIWTVQPH